MGVLKYSHVLRERVGICRQRFSTGPSLRDGPVAHVGEERNMTASTQQLGPTTTSHPRPITRALLLMNRKARGGKADVTPALDRLREAGFELIEDWAKEPSLLSKLIREYRDKVDVVIIGGGDGTISQAADGLVDAGLPLGILPLGTANDLARTLNLPNDLLAAAEVIIQAHHKRIDLGWVNGTHYFNVASIGLTTAVTRRMSRGGKSRWGILAYLFAAAQVVVRARPFTVDIDNGTETIRVRSVQVSVGNGRHYGGGMTVDEHAQIDDGLLNLYSLEISRWWQIIPLLPALWRGTLSSSKNARTLQGTQFEVRPLRVRPRTVMADGEVSGTTPARFRIVPKALSVFVPAESSPK